MLGFRYMFNVIAAIIGNYNFMPKMTFLDNLILYLKELTMNKYNKKTKKLQVILENNFLNYKRFSAFIQRINSLAFCGFL